MSNHQEITLSEDTELSEAMAAQNLTPADPYLLTSLPEESGNSPTRFQVDGDKAGTRNGWIYHHQVGDRNIYKFGTWKNDDVYTWTSDGKPLTAAEKAALAAKKKHLEQGKSDMPTPEYLELNAEYLATLTPEDGTHGYLTAKGITRLPASHGLLTSMEDPNEPLVIPLENAAGEIVGRQYIRRGEHFGWIKGFPQGTKKKGHFHVFPADHPEAPKVEPGQRKEWGSLEEGVATSLEVFNLSLGKVDAVCAFDAGNLVEVAAVLRDRYEKLAICADNDPGGKGLAKAREAAAAHGNAYVVMSPGGVKGCTDWNDFASLAGVENAKKIFRREWENAVQGEPVKGLASAKPKTLSLKELLSLPPQKMLIPGFLPHNELSAIFGPFESGKSFVAIDVALHLSLGLTRWHEWPIKKSGGVLYLNGEGYGGFTKRTLAFGAHHGVDVQEAKLRVSTIPFPLADEETGSQWAKEEIDKFREEYGEPPVLVVVDTLSRNFGGGDENSTKDMNLFVKTLDEIKAHADGAAVLIVHHTGVSSEAQKRGRGSSVLPGAMEAQWLCKKTGNSISLTNAKRKDLKGPDVFTFELTDYALGYDADGEPRESAALRFTGTAEAGKSGGSQKVRLTAVEDKVIQAIKEAAQKGHAVFEDGLFMGVEKNGAAEIFASIYSGCQTDKSRKDLFNTTIGRLETKKGQVIHRDGVVSLTSDVEMSLLNKAAQESKKEVFNENLDIKTGQKRGADIKGFDIRNAAKNEPQKPLFPEVGYQAETVANTEDIKRYQTDIKSLISDAPLPDITPDINDITPPLRGVMISGDDIEGEEGEGEFDIKVLEKYEAVFSAYEVEVGSEFEGDPEAKQAAGESSLADKVELTGDPDTDTTTTPPPAPSRERPFHPPEIPQGWRPQFSDEEALNRRDGLSAEEAYDRAKAEILRRIAEAGEGMPA